MSNSHQRFIIPILVIIAIAIWIVVPQSGVKKVPFTNKEIRARLGLDLVGGVQAMLEADLPANATIDPEAMNAARAIVENRVNGLGVTEALVQSAGDRRIVVEIPGETDSQKALAAVQQTGLLEFVDFSELSDVAARSLEEKTIQTDYLTGSSITSTVATTGTVFHTVMTGADLKRVMVQPSQTGGYEIAFELSDNGAKIFSDFTGTHIGKILAIVLDKTVISTPGIQSRISDGQGVITGNFTIESANAFAVQLRYGSLPIPLKVITSNTVGPTLGEDSLKKSVIAGAIGLLAVILFMVSLYRLPGVLADLALLVYALVSYAIFVFVPVTLTLPGIAGFVLSIGVAVDANILIFERLKEELRSGRTLRQAIDLGWSRAWPSIRDSNISTLITCVILFWFGSTYGASIVKGFSITLGIGVFVSMFTAIIVTRTFLHLVLDNIAINEHKAWFGL